jgi:hypothetical protein
MQGKTLSVEWYKEYVLLEYVRYANCLKLNEELLFCKELSSFTTGEEIFKTLDDFISHNLDWNYCVFICTDGAASMTGMKMD